MKMTTALFRCSRLIRYANLGQITRVATVFLLLGSVTSGMEKLTRQDAGGDTGTMFDRQGSRSLTGPLTSAEYTEVLGAITRATKRLLALYQEMNDNKQPDNTLKVQKEAKEILEPMFDFFTNFESITTDDQLKSLINKTSKLARFWKIGMNLVHIGFALFNMDLGGACKGAKAVYKTYTTVNTIRKYCKEIGKPKKQSKKNVFIKPKKAKKLFVKLNKELSSLKHYHFEVSILGEEALGEVQKQEIKKLKANDKFKQYWKQSEDSIRNKVFCGMLESMRENQDEGETDLAQFKQEVEEAVLPMQDQIAALQEEMASMRNQHDAWKKEILKTVKRNMHNNTYHIHKRIHESIESSRSSVENTDAQFRRCFFQAVRTGNFVTVGAAVEQAKTMLANTYGKNRNSCKTSLAPIKGERRLLLDRLAAETLRVSDNA